MKSQQTAVRVTLSHSGWLPSDPDEVAAIVRDALEAGHDEIEARLSMPVDVDVETFAEYRSRTAPRGA